MAIPAEYISSNSFSITGEYDGEFPVGKRIEVNQKEDGVARTSAVSSSYDDIEDLTTVEVKHAILTVNLMSIKRGVGDKTSLGLHYHDSDTDDAGFIPASLLTQEQIELLPNLPIPDPGGADDGKILGVLAGAYALVEEGTAAMVAVKETIIQADHGFAAKDCIRYDSGTTAWIKAQADTAENAESLGVVQSVDGASFVYVSFGSITGLSTLTPGALYYLSAATAGLLTVTEPDPATYISKPVLFAFSATEGFVLSMRGLSYV
jgi:hypothetical protein